MELKFKFYFLNEKGTAASFLRKKGTLTESELILSGDRIPIASIVAVDVRDQNLILAVASTPPQTVLIRTAKALRIKSELGLLRSAAWADKREKELAAKGESDRFRKVGCPNCKATIDLTDMDDSPQVYCEFCRTISIQADPAHGIAAQPDRRTARKGIWTVRGM